MTAKEARQKTTEGLGALAKKILIMLAIKMIFLIIFVIAVTIFLPRNDLINGIALAVTVVCVKHTGGKMDELDIIERELGFRGISF